MRHTLTTRGLLFLCALLLPWASAHAQWELDAQRSSINFVSIKNDAIGELHSFGSLLGFISADGGVQVSVDLNSVQTLIDIRNERMRELLFETVKFPTATVTAQIEPALLAAAAEGGTVSAEVPVRLSLHGLEGKLTVPLVAVGEQGGPLQVFSARPVLLNAADFGLAAGIEALREIAGLRAISNAIPITVHLVFSPAG